LIEVAPNVVPPVCRIADFSKYKYEEEKKERESKKHQHQSCLKEIRLKPHIEEHDYQVKLKQLLKFLKKKDKVKVSMFFRGREMSHAELGRRILDRIIKDSANESQMEKPPLMEGRVIKRNNYGKT
jgi:translation initiation factor IF-3